MSYPAFREVWANPPEHRWDPAAWPAITRAAPATVPAAHPAVAPGTQETWAMAGGWQLFPPVPAAEAYPPLVLRVTDPADPREVILVRDSRTAAWQVTRGDQGTWPVSHAAGFTVRNAITAAGMASLAQGVPSGNGLVLPGAGLTEPADRTGNAQLTVASLQVPGGEAGRAPHTRRWPGAPTTPMAWRTASSSSGWTGAA